MIDWVKFNHADGLPYVGLRVPKRWHPVFETIGRGMVPPPVVKRVPAIGSIDELHGDGRQRQRVPRWSEAWMHQ